MTATDHGTDRAAALLDAHVAHEIRQLRGEQFVVRVEREVRWALAQANRLTLSQVVARDRVKAVAHKYVSTFALPGAIPEIVGDIATHLRAHPANDTTVEQLIPRAHAEAVVAKFAQLPQVREWIAVQVTESPAVQAWLADYLRTIAVDSNLKLAKKVPGVSLGLSLGGRLAGGAVTAADQRSREMAEKAAAALLQKWRADMLRSLTDETVAEMMLGVWDRAAGMPMRTVLAAVRDDDLIDAMSILYDLWLELRTSGYLRTLVDSGVDYFYDTYGDVALDELLTEFGLDADDLIEEALRFAPQAIEALHEAGLLEQILRRQLAAFYDSPQAQAILRD